MVRAFFCLFVLFVLFVVVVVVAVFITVVVCFFVLKTLLCGWILFQNANSQLHSRFFFFFLIFLK